MLLIIGFGLALLVILANRNNRNSRRRSTMFDRNSRISNRDAFQEDKEK